MFSGGSLILNYFCAVSGNVTSRAFYSFADIGLMQGGADRNYLARGPKSLDLYYHSPFLLSSEAATISEYWYWAMVCLNPTNIAGYRKRFRVVFGQPSWHTLSIAKELPRVISDGKRDSVAVKYINVVGQGVGKVFKAHQIRPNITRGTRQHGSYGIQVKESN